MPSSSLRTLEADKATLRRRGLGPARSGQAQGRRPCALRAYQEIILRGLRLTTPGGPCVTCSCSGPCASRAQFDELVSAAAAQSGRSIQILERRGAGRDHPELAGVPETGQSQVLESFVYCDKHLR